DNPQQTLKGKYIVDSGCSRHKTGNKDYLVDYQYFNGDLLLLEPITVENTANHTAGLKEANNSAGTQDNLDAKNSNLEVDHAQEYYVLPLWSSYTSTVKSSNAKNGDEKLNEDTDSKTNEESKDLQDQAYLEELKRLKRQEKEANDAVKTLRKMFAQSTEDLLLQLRAARASSTNFVNTASTPVNAASTPTNHDDSQIPALEDIYDHSRDRIFTSASYDDEGAVADFINLETTMNKKAIGTKWVYRNKKDERGIVVKNKARLVAHRHRQEDEIYYDEVFAYVARIEAIRIFLAFVSYMGFIVYQMDVKSAFLYGKIDEEVYVSQPPGCIDPKFPNNVYKVVKALYGLHQAPRACVKTASTPIETKKSLVKDEEAGDVDIHLYRSMIGSLMYLTASRPDIMYVICACSRFHVTPKTSHLQAVKRIIRLGKKMQFGLVLGTLNEGEGSGAPTKTQPTHSPTHSSTRDQPSVIKSSSSHETTQDSKDSLEGTNRSEGDQVQTPHDSPLLVGHTFEKAKGALNLEELFFICTNLSNRVFALETVKDAQAVKIIALKARIKKLEKKSKPRISHHRAWLKSVQRLSMKKSTFDADLDADQCIDYMDTEEPVNEGRITKETEELVSTARPGHSTVRPDVGTTDLIVPLTRTRQREEEVTKAELAKKITRSDLVVAQIAEDAEVARLVYEKELAELEREKEKRQREEEVTKAAIAKMYDEVQAGIEADALFAAKLQQEKRKEYTIKERAKFLAETIVAQRKFRAAQRSAEIRSRLPTKSQLRNFMMIYLKNMGGYKYSQLKVKIFAKIQGLYERQKRVIDDFKPMDSDDAVDKEKVLEEPNNIKIEVKQEGDEENIRKRPGKRLKMKATKKSKRQKTDSDLKIEEHLKTFLTMFEETADDDLWKNQEEWILKIWNFYDKCGVHTLTLEDGTEIYMLAERRYPLTKETLERMLALRLIAECESEAVFDLLRFIQNAPCYCNEALAILEQTATDDKDWKLIKEKFKELQCVWIHPPGVQEAQNEET
nr:copia protein [Tanacetum cinerariifolium]